MLTIIALILLVSIPYIIGRIHGRRMPEGYKMVETTVVTQPDTSLPATKKALDKMLQLSYVQGFIEGYDARVNQYTYRVNRANTILLGHEDKFGFGAHIQCRHNNVHIPHPVAQSKPKQQPQPTSGDGYFIEDPQTGEKVWIAA